MDKSINYLSIKKKRFYVVQSGTTILSHLVEHVPKLSLGHAAQLPQQLHRHTSRLVHFNSDCSNLLIFFIYLLYNVVTSVTHCLIVQSELLLGHEADMEPVVLQEDVVSSEAVTDVKLTNSLSLA